MSDIATPRYGYEPRAAFAATRAFAGRDRRKIPGTTASPRPTRARSILARLSLRRSA
jgi:hypothetical protein